LEALSALSDDKLSPQYQSFQQEFIVTTIPAAKRLELRQRIAKIEDRIADHAKKILRDQHNQGQSLVQSCITDLQGSGKHFIVRLLQDSTGEVLANTSLEIVTSCKKALDRDVAVILFTVDKKKNVVLIASNVSKALIDKGFKATDWVGPVAKLLGGKGGGRPQGDIAQGHGSAVEKLNEAMEEAEKFAQKTLQ